MNIIYDTPFRTLKARNYWRISSVAVLLIIACFSFSLINYMGYGIIPLGFYFLGMILFIRFPGIELYDTYFTITKTSILGLFPKFARFNYNEIKSVEFSEGYTNWTMIILTTLLSGGRRYSRIDERYSKADSLKITLNNNAESEINRIGSRESFLEIIELVKKKINLSNQDTNI